MIDINLTTLKNFITPKNILILIIVVIFIYFIFFNKKREDFTAEEMKKYPEAIKINCEKNKLLLKQLKNMNNLRCKKQGKTDRDTINNKWLCYDDVGKEVVTQLDAESNCVMSDLVNKKSSVTPYHAKSQLLLPHNNLPKPTETEQQSQRIKSKPSTEPSISTKPIKESSKQIKEKFSHKRYDHQEHQIHERVEKFEQKKEDKIMPIPLSQNMISEGPEFINKFFVPAFDNKKVDTYASFNDAPIGTPNNYSASAPYDDVSRLTSDPAFLYQLSKYEETKPIDGIEYRSNIKN